MGLRSEQRVLERQNITKKFVKKCLLPLTIREIQVNKLRDFTLSQLVWQRSTKQWELKGREVRGKHTLIHYWYDC